MKTASVAREPDGRTVIHARKAAKAEAKAARKAAKEAAKASAAEE